MPTSAPKQDRPQPVEKYTYPLGDTIEDGKEVIKRHGIFTTGSPGGGAHEVEFKQTDGRGVLPIEGQPNTTTVTKRSAFPAGQGVTLWFGREIGSGGGDAYVAYQSKRDVPEEPSRPPTQTQH